VAEMVANYLGLENGDGNTSGNGSSKKPKTAYSTASDAIAELERQHGPRAAEWTYCNRVI
jgi:hypothetical protein